MIARRRFVAITASALAIACSLPIARAQGTRPNVEILVLYARKEPGSGHVGPGVPKLPQLSQAPFSAYNAFELVDRRRLAFGGAKATEPWQGKPATSYQLPTGKGLDVALLAQRPDGRFEMGASLGKDAADRLRWTAPMNEPFLVGGQSYKDGTLVIGITLIP